MQNLLPHVRFYAMCFFMTWSVTACAQPFTPEQSAALDAAITEIDAQIASAKQESALYTGGLVKTVVELRLATLRQTRSMLDQRKLANSYGVAVTYTVDGSTFAPGTTDQIAGLEAEIAELEQTIVAQQAEADRYAGGLVQAMALSTVATSRQSLAMLQQQRLALTYGLPQYVGAAPTAGSSAASTVGATTPAGAPNVGSPPSDSAGGPFGISMGLSKSGVESVVGAPLTEVEGQPNLFVTTMPPRPHPSFENYVLKILPTAGVCQVRAIGVTIRSSSHGVEIQQAFNDLTTMVGDTYGEYRRVDVLLPGSIWDEPEDWMMALRQNERQLQAVWDEDKGSTLSNEVSSIILGTSALSSSEGYLILQYSFENEELCDSEEKQLQRGIF